MSGLAALLAEHNPPSVYQWHSAAPVADVQHAVEHAGWTFRYLDGWTLEDRATFLKAAASSLELSDAEAESVGGLSSGLEQIEVGGRGLVLLWDGWSPLARSDNAAFEEAVEAFRQRAHKSGAGKLAVILRGDGPELDLPELPIKR
jgi:hypothetical protein